MSALITRWLNEDVCLSELVTDLPQDFRNGYLLGELLHKFNQAKELSQFRNTQRTDDILRNYCRLEPILTQMGQNFTVRTAIDIIMMKSGVAASLLYHLKTQLERVRDPVNTIGKADPGVIEPFPLVHPRPSKPIAESSKSRIFEEALRMSLEPQNHIYQRIIEEPFVGEKKRQQELAQTSRVLKRRFQEETANQIRADSIQSLQQAKISRENYQEDLSQWQHNLSIRHEEEEHLSTTKKLSESKREALRSTQKYMDSALVENLPVLEMPSARPPSSGTPSLPMLPPSDSQEDGVGAAGGPGDFTPPAATGIASVQTVTVSTDSKPSLAEHGLGHSTEEGASFPLFEPVDPTSAGVTESEDAARENPVLPPESSEASPDASTHEDVESGELTLAENDSDEREIELTGARASPPPQQQQQQQASGVSAALLTPSSSSYRDSCNPTDVREMIKEFVQDFEPTPNRPLNLSLIQSAPSSNEMKRDWERTDSMIQTLKSQREEKRVTMQKRRECFLSNLYENISKQNTQETFKQYEIFLVQKSNKEISLDSELSSILQYKEVCVENRDFRTRQEEEWKDNNESMRRQLSSDRYETLKHLIESKILISLEVGSAYHQSAVRTTESELFSFVKALVLEMVDNSLSVHQFQEIRHERAPDSVVAEHSRRLVHSADSKDFDFEDYHLNLREWVLRDCDREISIPDLLGVEIPPGMSLEDSAGLAPTMFERVLISLRRQNDPAEVPPASLSLPESEYRLCLIGENHCGKKTLASFLSRDYQIYTIDPFDVIQREVDGPSELMKYDRLWCAAPRSHPARSIRDDLNNGVSVSDEKLLDIVLREIARVPSMCPESRGWVVVNYPQTATQLRLLLDRVQGKPKTIESSLTVVNSVAPSDVNPEDPEYSFFDGLIELQADARALVERGFGPIQNEQSEEFNVFLNPPSAEQISDGTFSLKDDRDHSREMSSMLHESFQGANAPLRAACERYGCYYTLDVSGCDISESESRLSSLLQTIKSDRSTKESVWSAQKAKKQSEAAEQAALLDQSKEFSERQAMLREDAWYWESRGLYEDIAIEQEPWVDPRPFLERPLPLDIRAPLHDTWTSFEPFYISCINGLLDTIRRDYHEMVAHFDLVRQAFLSFVRRPHTKQLALEESIVSINSIPQDMRCLPETKNEGHMIVFDLNRSLWSQTLKRESENKEEMARVQEDGILEDHLELLHRSFSKAIQVELDCFYVSSRLLYQFVVYNETQQLPDLGALESLQLAPPVDPRLSKEDGDEFDWSVFSFSLDAVSGSGGSAAAKKKAKAPAKAPAKTVAKATAGGTKKRGGKEEEVETKAAWEVLLEQMGACADRALNAVDLISKRFSYLPLPEPVGGKKGAGASASSGKRKSDVQLSDAPLPTSVDDPFRLCMQHEARKSEVRIQRLRRKYAEVEVELRRLASDAYRYMDSVSEEHIQRELASVEKCCEILRDYVEREQPVIYHLELTGDRLLFDKTKLCEKSEQSF